MLTILPSLYVCLHFSALKQRLPFLDKYGRIKQYAGRFLTRTGVLYRRILSLSSFTKPILLQSDAECLEHITPRSELLVFVGSTYTRQATLVGADVGHLFVVRFMHF